MRLPLITAALSHLRLDSITHCRYISIARSTHQSTWTKAWSRPKPACLRTELETKYQKYPVSCTTGSCVCSCV